MLLRISRNLLVPLWAVHIGISVTALGIITSAGAILETIMVIPAGRILDHKGRKWSAVPCTLGLALGLGLLPLTNSIFTLSAIYGLTAFTNGIGSGIIMTISSDLAPKKAAGEFLGIWRFLPTQAPLLPPWRQVIWLSSSAWVYPP